VVTDVANVAIALTAGLEGRRSVLHVGDRTTSAAELDARVRGVAAWLAARGVAPGHRTVVFVPPGPDLVAAVLALLWVGAVAVLADPDQPGEVVRAQVRRAEPRWVVADPRLSWAWSAPLFERALAVAGRRLPPRPDGATVLPLPPAGTGEAAATSVTAVERDRNDEALVVFTSGTTDAPRGVVHTHGSLAAFLDNVRVAVGGLGFASYVAETAPQLFYGLALGAACHVARGRGERRAARLWRLMEEGAAEAWFGGAWLWARWLREGRRPPGGLRALVLGAAPVTKPFLRALVEAAPDPLRILCLYGLTEAGPVATVDGREKAAWTGDGDLVGRALPGVRASVVGGEVRVAGPSVAPRYLGGPAIRDGVGTGDLGRLEGDDLVLLGRAKDMIVRRGLNVYPGLLEPVLARSMGEVALVGVFDARAQDERVVLVHAGSEGLLPPLGEAAPDHVLRVDALPRRGRQHKVDREALRRLARERFFIPG
jgi:acyl-CoA synthetase (AMP-forming)/AMP-acid ligase II